MIASGHPLLDIDYTVLIQLGIFLAMVVVLSTFLFKPFMKVHDQREAATTGARHDADAMAKKAAENGAICEQQIAKARAKALEERGVLRTEAHQREREIIAQGRALADAHLDKAKRQIQESVGRARNELGPKIQELATDIAKKVLGREVRS